MKTPINKQLKVNNKNGLELYYKIEKANKLEQSRDDRFLILDSSQNYFNDFILDEDDREEEIQALLKCLETTTIEEMASIYDYQLYDNRKKVCKDLEETEDTLLDNEYVNRIVDTKRNKVWYCVKSDYRINNFEDIKGEEKTMETEKTLVYILMQELFENGLFDIEELKEKYTLTKKQEKLLTEIYKELYEQEEE